MSHYHFIAIGGAGMSGIARILMESGHTVSGSDIKASDTTRRLMDMGATVKIGHSPENIPAGAEVVVVSSAIHPDNPEVVEARMRGLRILHRADMLAMLLNQRKGIAVTGAHGKTTTTSMIAMVLEKAGLDPTVLIGGEVSDFGGNAKLGRGDFIVAEADESDGSFLKLEPLIGVVTNIDDDHLDYYGNVGNVKKAFRVFVAERIRADGNVVYCNDDKNTREVVAGVDRRTVSYGLRPGSTVMATDVGRRPWGSTFTVVADGKRLGTIELKVPGMHNIQNALAAVAVARLLSLSFDSIAEGLFAFKGAQRRLQLIGHERGVLVLDDYAHHPTEIKASLKAIRDQVEGRIFCIYQPHRYSRTLALKDEFGDAFQDCDQLFLADIYAGPGEQPIEGVCSSLIADSVRASTGVEPVYFHSWDDIVNNVVSSVAPGDVIVTMGAGDIYTLSSQILNRLRSL